MKEKLTARKVLHLALVLVVLLVLVAYRTWFSAASTTKSVQIKDQICDLSHNSCSLQIDGKPLTVLIPQLPVRAEHDFVLRLEGGDPAITPVKAWLEGRDMFMGTIPVSFEQIAGGWQGSTLVGSCTSSMMVWLLNIEWSNGVHQQLALSIARE
ncbi:hypothetical protein [Aeromonas sp. MdU4]|uniref:hypothetical protein n=1 Tax=Aeromonas sp. MdU4 TaxID=3342819 RepID=UPI0035BAEF2B